MSPTSILRAAALAGATLLATTAAADAALTTPIEGGRISQLYAEVFCIEYPRPFSVCASNYALFVLEDENAELNETIYAEHPDYGSAFAYQYSVIHQGNDNTIIIAEGNAQGNYYFTYSYSAFHYEFELHQLARFDYAGQGDGLLENTDTGGAIDFYTLGATGVIEPGRYRVSQYYNYNIRFELTALPSPIPLPAALPLFFAGLAGLAAVARRNGVR